MKKYLLITLVPLFGAGCASHNMALEDARKSYKAASTDVTVSENAPVALHDADLALQKANKAKDDGAEKEEVTHLADIASKRVEIATIEAKKKIAENDFQDVSKDRTEVVLSAREKEIKDAHEKSELLQVSNQKLENDATESKTQSTALTAQNQELAKELADLKMKPTSRGMELTLRDTVFEFGKADLTSGARRDLEKISQELKNASGQKILIEGHTDSVGSDSFNDALSQRRAEAVKDILARDTDSSRITASGLGKKFPVASNSTEAGRQQNRRVTIIVLSAEKEIQENNNAR